MQTFIINKKNLQSKIDNYVLNNHTLHQRYENYLKWKTKYVDSGQLYSLKETSHDLIFLESIFEDSLGYTSGGKHPTIKLKEKSVTDSTVPDGKLGYYDGDNYTISAVIELKDADIKLDDRQKREKNYTPIEQAFGYVPKQGGKCKWVIVSNFTELRLYSSCDIGKYEQFNLINLTESDFYRFSYLLSFENLIHPINGESIVERLYLSTNNDEEAISNDFYNKYRNLRKNLFISLKSENSTVDPLILFEKTNKILDRFIFVCFCEDKKLLPDDTIKGIVDRAKNSYGDEVAWSEFKQLCKSINSGNSRMGINQYNGGLFKDDDVLDSLHVTNDILNQFSEISSNYDFDSDLNVNILGHIFEQSISDIEEIKAEISGRVIPEKKEKKNASRKKDGIFYTPNYVTRYIVEQTIGRWCSETQEKLKQELIGDNGFSINVPISLKSKKTKHVVISEWKELPANYNTSAYTPELNALVELHTQYLSQYSEKLKSIRVLDPACGSGAFLNQARDYLADQGLDVWNSMVKIQHGQTVLGEWDGPEYNKEILRNNLFGVDLNKESIEITKLSLWLNTADSGKTLTTLEQNIICHNSIISENANELPTEMWNRLFPSIMASGGFDIVIGNPPYGARVSESDKKYIKEKYETYQYNYDTYRLFIELSLKLVKEKGYIGLITPDTFLTLQKTPKIRQFISDNNTVLKLVSANVFEDPMVYPIILIIKRELPISNTPFDVIIHTPKKITKKSTFLIENTVNSFVQSDLKENNGYIFNFKCIKFDDSYKLMQKIKSKSTDLQNFINISWGVKPYQSNKGIPKQEKGWGIKHHYESDSKIDDTYMKYIHGRDIQQYSLDWQGVYIKYGKNLAEPRQQSYYTNPKILLRQTADYPIATYDDNQYIGNATLHCIYPKEDKKDISLYYILGILNSKLMKWVYQYTYSNDVGKCQAEVAIAFVKSLPYVVSENQLVVIEIVKNLLDFNNDIISTAKKFVKYIVEKYSLEKELLSKSSDLLNLSYSNFLKKTKLNLSKKEEMDMMGLFDEIKQNIDSRNSSIIELTKKLDDIVYSIYQLTDAEIKLIEDKYR